jgi:nicotinate phosphoribosyltransferase
MKHDDTEPDISQRWAHRENLALLTDFYQLTMMGGYLKSGRKDLTACFNYSFRDLPPHNGFAITAGLEQLLDLVEGLRFTEQDLRYLSGLGIFEQAFIDYLGSFRSRCSIEAVPEGTVVFPHEPVLQVVGPLIEAQLLETAVLNTLNYQTLIATKAARIRLACGEDNLVEFGLRRAQGPDGGLSGSRAAFIGGADSTSNVLAGKVFGIPLQGTHAHSWVMSFEDELEAFRAYAACYPDPILLVDTYDTLASGLPNAVTVFKELRAEGRAVRGAIRLDSGDLARLSKAAWRMFTEAGFDDPLIVASNELDEDLIADLKRQGAPINSWGVGTHLITSSDHPALGGVYKLVAVRPGEGTWEPRIKLSSNPVKMTDPGRKRLVRYYDGENRPLADLIRLDDEDVNCIDPGQAYPPVPFAERQDLSFLRAVWDATRCEQLLQPVMADGARIDHRPSLEEIRARAGSQVRSLPEEIRRLRNPEIYEVGLSPRLAAEKVRLIRQTPGVVGAGPAAS